MVSNLKFIILFFWLSPALSYAAELECKIVSRGDETRLTFSSSIPINTILMDETERSSKLFLKISAGDGVYRIPQLPDWEIPERTALFGFRVIPYNEKTLLIVDLVDSVAYEFLPGAQGFAIVLKDREMRSKDRFYLARGRARQEREEFEAALGDFKMLIERDKSNAEAQFRLGQTYLNVKKYGHAEYHLRKSLQLGFRESETFATMARLYRLTGKPDLADHFSKKHEQSQVRQKVAHPDTSGKGPDSGKHQFVSSGGDSTNLAMNALNWLAMRPWIGQIRRHRATPAVMFAIGVLFLLIAARQVFASRKDSGSNAPSAPGRIEESVENHTPPKAAVMAAKPAPALDLSAINKRLSEWSASDFVPDMVFSPEVIRQIDRSVESAKTADQPAAIPDFQNIHPFGSTDINQLAQRLKTGVGELELARNLAAAPQQNNLQIKRNYDFIHFDSNDRNIDTLQIARDARIGQDEVAFFLQMNHRK